jgi:streptogramin lyase
VAVGDEGIWIIGYGGNAVVEVDPSTDEVTTTLPLDRPTGIAVGEGAVWVVIRPNGTVTKTDPDTGKTTATIVFNDTPPRSPRHSVDWSFRSDRTASGGKG